MSVDTSGIANVLRLSGLKNVAGRKKILPGAEYLEDLDQAPSNDFSGTSQEQKNIPTEDMGVELTSQAYDVRANEELYPKVKSDNEENIFSNLGKAFSQNVVMKPEAKQERPNYLSLAEAFSPSKISESYGASEKTSPEQKGFLPTQQYFSPSAMMAGYNGEEINPQKISEQEPLETPLEEPQEKVPFITSKDLYNPYKFIGDYGKMIKAPHIPTENQKITGEFENIPPSIPQVESKENVMNQISEAQKTPFEKSVYGAGDIVANSPDLQYKFKEITGIDYEPQIKEQMKDYEEAMEGVEDFYKGQQKSLSENASKINERILTNTATDQDKFLIGMALLMPLIVGGFFGKEAGIGALGGAAKGLSESYARRGKEIREDEAQLLDISKQQALNQKQLADFQFEKAQLPKKIRESFPKDEQEHLKGMKFVSEIDPETNEPFKDENGEDIIDGVQIKPGLVATPDQVTSKEDKTDIRKLANELNVERQNYQKLDRTTKNIIFLLNQLEGDPLFEKIWRNYVTTKNPDTLAEFGPEVEYQGRPVKASTQLAHEIQNLADAYRRVQHLRGFGQQIVTHIDKIIANPLEGFINPRDAIAQALNLRNQDRDLLIDNVRRSGFVEKYLLKDLADSDREVYRTLNLKEQGKRAEEIKRKYLIGQEQNLK